MNRSILVGRLTATPELRTTPNGVVVTQVTVAINRMPNANGERVADFINVVIWRKQAENVVKYCSKGSLLAIEGRLQSRSYEAQNGSKRYVTEVIADNVTFLGSKTAEQQTGQEARQQTQQPTQTVSQVQATIEEDPFSDFGQEVVIRDENLPF